MVVVTVFEGAKSLTVRGRLGRPNGLGLMKMGWSKPGDFFPEAGTYQKRTRFGRRLIVKMRHTVPTNPRTSLQQFRRDYFRYSVAVYHGLTDELRTLYKRRASKYGITGYNYYISEYSSVRPSHVGNVRCGFTKLGVKMWLEAPPAPAPALRFLPFNIGE